MSTRSVQTSDTYARTALQKASLVVGIVFLLVGILGFVPGITANFDEMTFAGHMSGALLLGVFQVSILHNMVHLLFGILGVALAARPGWSRQFLIWGGVVYLLFWLYGLVVGHDSTANFVPFNDADDWLHLLLGVGMIALGVFLSRDRQVDTSGRRA